MSVWIFAKHTYIISVLVILFLLYSNAGWRWRCVSKVRRMTGLRSQLHIGGVLLKQTGRTCTYWQPLPLTSLTRFLQTKLVHWIESSSFTRFRDACMDFVHIHTWSTHCLKQHKHYKYISIYEPLFLSCVQDKIMVEKMAKYFEASYRPEKRETTPEETHTWAQDRMGKPGAVKQQRSHLPLVLLIIQFRSIHFYLCSAFSNRHDNKAVSLIYQFRIYI